ncbi:sodium:solute symporter family protein [Pseudonocardia sp. KRD291]|uniref:sodium:solute symporter family protein n=1 Tax=Pseudonocardia sp. KRD291 TaxID=2792007 RepID=UPI001C49E158|nr:sodium:solute symporter family protein [Pseudonocardia sp. KRD291]MBW0104101.1 sodium:solute symporter family protein [Pseudonocardia sp. KRD291]
MESVWIVLLCVAVYMAILALISFLVRRSSGTSKSFTTGGKAFPAILIGFLLASEFIGTTASVGTAQVAYRSGVSAAWNIAVLGLGFVLFAWLLAHRFRALGESTISGALARFYGERVRKATSVLMVCALMTVAVSTYASGGALLSSLLGIGNVPAILLVGIAATSYVLIGGMRSVIYTNVLHAVVMLAGIAILAAVGVNRAGGAAAIRMGLPDEFFSISGVGWPQIFAWLVAGVGAIFATQYVVQAIATTPDPGKARIATLWSAAILIPFGVLASVVGIAAAVIYPGIDSIQALPSLTVDLPPLVAGFVVAGLAGAIFGTVAAITLACSTLLVKDFIDPNFNSTGDDRRSVLSLRVATVAVGLLPVVLAITAEDVVAVTFLAKALRAGLAVLVLLMFFRPGFGTRTGALVSIFASLVATIGWFLADNPFGIDNAYIAIAVPMVTMTLFHLAARLRGPRAQQERTASAATEPSA